MFSFLLFCMGVGFLKAQSDCGIRNLFGPTGQISSPNFPLPYPNNLDCYNFITVSSGETIIFTFLAFDTEYRYDWVTIICESGNASRSTSFSGSELPQVLTLSSCNRINVHFRSDDIITKTGFNLTYNVTTDNVIGGFTTRPLNAFPRSDKDNLIIFNCTTSSEYLPWWTFSPQSSHNYIITNSTCRVITSMPYSAWFKTETLGPGSCNLIVLAPAINHQFLAGSVVCTDSTLSAARAILAPINLALRLAAGMNFSAIVSDVVRDEEIRISCDASFSGFSSKSSLGFTNILYSGGPVVQMRIMRIYWTSERNDTSNTSSYVLVKSNKDDVIPPQTLNIVCYFYTNSSDLSGDSPMELSISTDPFKVLYWPTEDNMKITGDNNGQIRTPAMLNCWAAANPPATYVWIDESNGDTIIGPTITINHSGKYTCNASNIIRRRRYQRSKSITLKAVEDNSTLNQIQVVLVLLGMSVLTIIVILVITVIRLCRQQKITGEHGKEYELPHRGGEGNLYEDRLGTDTNDVNESEYDNIDDTPQHLQHISGIYDELEFDK